MVLMNAPATTGRLPLSPGLPNLRSIPIGGEQDAPQDKAGAVPKMFFSIEKGIDVIAKAVPKVASRLDEIKMSLRGIMAEALEGASGKPQGDDEDILSGEGEPL